jgi:hypothetical protein
MNEQKNIWNEFDSATHLLPELRTSQFDSLHEWDLAWELLEPINIATDDDHEVELSKRMSKGQKALYFFWYLDGQVTNGGFAQFYMNGYDKYLPPILEGLEVIGDLQLIALVSEANNYVSKNASIFIEAAEKEDFETPYEQLPRLDELDDNYYKLHKETIKLIEAYARANKEEFVKLK